MKNEFKRKKELTHHETRVHDFDSETCVNQVDECQFTTNRGKNPFFSTQRSIHIFANSMG